MRKDIPITIDTQSRNTDNRAKTPHLRNQLLSPNIQPLFKTSQQNLLNPATIMLFPTLLAATTAALASASPLKPRYTGNYTFSVTSFTFGGTSAAAAGWAFNVSAQDSAWGPGFASIHCSGNTLDADYVPCTAINADESVSAYVRTGGLLNLFVKYEVLGGEARYDFVGNTTAVSDFECGTCSDDYAIAVTNITAVA
ncbi:hypothetical protein BDV97DRAFT_402116 [Delphinella strobiligena]|nr:hypothetical protein BDV97DRAFT_402116 [Delphinella strobiligena]